MTKAEQDAYLAQVLEDLRAGKKVNLRMTGFLLTRAQLEQRLVWLIAERKEEA